MSSRANIVIDQGTPFQTIININDAVGNPIDMSTYTFKSQIRKSYTSTNAYSFSVTGDDQGVVMMYMHSNTSASIPSGRYVYDLLATDNTGSSTRLLEGQVTITPSVSR